MTAQVARFVVEAIPRSTQTRARVDVRWRPANPSDLPALAARFPYQRVLDACRRQGRAYVGIFGGCYGIRGRDRAEALAIEVGAILEEAYR